MSFDLPAELESRVVRYAERANVTPDEAVRALLEEGLRVQATPARRLIGLFSSPEDRAIMEEVDKVIQEGRRYDAA